MLWCLAYKRRVRFGYRNYVLCKKSSDYIIQPINTSLIIKLSLLTHGEPRPVVFCLDLVRNIWKNFSQKKCAPNHGCRYHNHRGE